MRIAHILRKYDPAEWGGTETAIHRLASGLATQGAASVVYAPRLEATAVAPDPLAEVDCTLRRFRACAPIWGISAARRRELVALGGNLISFDLAGMLWREPGLDVIHSHALGRLGAIAGAVARRRHLPFVVSIHGGAYDLPEAVRRDLHRPVGGWDWGRVLGFFLRSRALLGSADALITVNPREAELLRQRHPGRRVVVQPHGVAAALYAQDRRADARAQWPELAGRTVFVLPARIDPVKNQDWLVAQMGPLVRRHPRALLVLAGAATDRIYGEQVRARIAADGLGGHVLLAGPLPPGDPRLIGLLQQATAVILPSRSETFGLVLIEAWAAGTPVLSSRTSGALALLRDGENGLLFDLERPETFQEAADRLLADPARARAWGEAGLARVRADYDVRVLAGRMRDVYAELIQEKYALRHPPGR